jgi:hypothetical protein
MSNIITFIDSIGRTIIGEAVESTPDGQKVDSQVSFIIKNPAILHVQPTPQGQLNVQTIPLYFRDFVSDKNKEEGTFWKYNYANCIIGLNVENDARLIDQYHKLFQPMPVPVAPAGENEPQKTIKLFDD